MNLTQSRNILSGTRPWDPGSGSNSDANFVVVNGQAYYLPNNVTDPADVPNTTGGFFRGTPPVAGRWGEPDMVPSYMTPPFYSGQWAFYNNPVRAGLSKAFVNPNAGWYLYTDADDDNFDTTDSWPTPLFATAFGPPEAMNYYDLSGSLSLPVERIRRFVTPIDVAGDSLLGQYNNSNQFLGADLFGRVAYFKYFRPPGLPTVVSTIAGPGVNTYVESAPPTSYDVPYLAGTTAYPGNNVYHGFESYRSQLMTASAVANVDPITNGLYGGTLSGAPELFLASAPADVANTTLGAAPSTPVFTNGTSNGLARTGSPSNVVYAADPTIDAFVNSNSNALMSVNGNAPVGPSNPPAQPPYFVSPNLNDADEMRIYPSQLPDFRDAPYGPQDLEWLYRLQDSDGASLSSRLAALAPVSFLNPLDGLRRRRMFSLQSFEPTSFVWAYDNPGGAFPINSVMNSSAILGNFAMQVANPLPLNSNMSLNNAYLSAYQRNIASSVPPTLTTPYITNPSLPTTVNVLPNVTPFGTPSLAHRDRKINLNYPLPVSDNPSEPTRLKWINEAYQLMLQVLPPMSVDTAEEHAALSQYLTNLIDFRDPDATMTHFVSPDVVMIPGTPPTITGGVNTGTSGTPATLAFAATNPTGAQPLEQFGMEYNPVAINEVLAYSFSSKNGASGSGTKMQLNRFFVELVNTLTESAAPPYTPIGAPAAGVGVTPLLINTSDLDLRDWDLILVPDDGFNRPDPTTGQILDPTRFKTTTFGRIPLQAASFLTPGGVTTGSTATGNSTALTTPSDVILPAMTTDVNPQAAGVAGVTANPAPYFYVISNQNYNPTPVKAEVGTPTVAQQLQPNVDWFNPPSSGATPQPVGPNQSTTTISTVPTPAEGSGTDTYYWLCLRRPASALPLNTATPSLDGAAFPAANPMVVVDAMRFAFIEAGGKGTINTSGNDTATQGTSVLYSWQRMQPFRGGHAIPSAFDPNIASTTTGPTIIDSRYGFSEQMAVPTSQQKAPGGNFTYGLFGTAATPHLTQNVYHTIAFPNDSAFDGTTGGAKGGGGRKGGPDPWDYFVFNDRDFTSVAELPLVPGCPPGLFTKQFVENNPGNILNWPQYALRTSSTPAFSTTASPTQTTPGTGAMASPVLFPNSRLWPNAPTLPRPTVPPIPAPNPPYEASDPNPQATSQSYPYLVDEFFYTGADPQAVGPLAGVVPGVIYGGPPWGNISGPAGAGWYKMMEFFEVPSTIYGATDEVAKGVNYDWARQDTKAGLMNLNLIVDEEVFLGLVGNAGMLNAEIGSNGNGLNVFFNGSTLNEMPSGLNNWQVNNPEDGVSVAGTATAVTETGEVDNNLQAITGYNAYYSYLFVPKVVTMSSLVVPPGGSNLTAGAPMNFRNAPAGFNANHVAAYPIPNQGFFDLSYAFTPVNGAYVLPGDSRLKGCFTDFLKLRHGGSGYLFAWGNGPVGTPYVNPNGTSDLRIAAERPFRSLSFPDINYTIMRPAPLPPVAERRCRCSGTAGPVARLCRRSRIRAAWVHWRQPGDHLAAADLHQLQRHHALPAHGCGRSGGERDRQCGIDLATHHADHRLGPGREEPVPVHARQLHSGLDRRHADGGVGRDSRDGPRNAAADTGSPPVPDPRRCQHQQQRRRLRALGRQPDPGRRSRGHADAGSRPDGGSPNGNRRPAPSQRERDRRSDVVLGSRMTNDIALGSNLTSGKSSQDARQHPYFRSEWMQRIANLTTVRTHQYAVWITVGFFEVTQQGDAVLASNVATTSGGYDILGKELGMLNGRNVRHRGFFLLDRTLGTGFNSQTPIDDYSKMRVVSSRS